MLDLGARGDVNTLYVAFRNERIYSVDQSLIPTVLTEIVAVGTVTNIPPITVACQFSVDRSCCLEEEFANYGHCVAFSALMTVEVGKIVDISMLHQILITNSARARVF